MFRSGELFTNQFEPHGDGYVYYPSRREGGKFVSKDEYQHLVDGWNRANTGRGFWAFVLALFGAIFVWLLLSRAMDLPP